MALRWKCCGAPRSHARVGARRPSARGDIANERPRENCSARALPSSPAPKQPERGEKLDIAAERATSPRTRCPLSTATPTNNLSARQASNVHAPPPHMPGLIRHGCAAEGPIAGASLHRNRPHAEQFRCAGCLEWHRAATHLQGHARVGERSARNPRAVFTPPPHGRIRPRSRQRLT